MLHWASSSAITSTGSFTCIGTPCITRSCTWRLPVTSRLGCYRLGDNRVAYQYGNTKNWECCFRCFFEEISTRLYFRILLFHTNVFVGLIVCLSFCYIDCLFDRDSPRCYIIENKNVPIYKIQTKQLKTIKFSSKNSLKFGMIWKKMYFCTVRLSLSKS